MQPPETPQAAYCVAERLLPADSSIEWLAPVSQPGDFVILGAQMDLIAIRSA